MDGNQKIRHMYYKKEMTSKGVTHKMSALGEREKRMRLRNTSRELDQEIKNDILSDYMKNMKNSGWSHKERLDTLKAVKASYTEMLRKNDAGECHLCRLHEYNREERDAAKED